LTKSSDDGGSPVWLHHKIDKINNGVEQCRVVDWSIKTFFLKIKNQGKNYSIETGVGNGTTL